MEAIEALNTANAEFVARLNQVTDDQWELPTPCSEWNVRALVNHVLLGTRMSVQVLDAMPTDEIIGMLNDDLISGSNDLAADFTTMASDMVERFAAPGGLDGIVDHPAGQFPRSVFVGFRIGDGAVHAWDLARAIGADTTLNPAVVDFLWEAAQPQREMLAASGMFGEGASGTMSDDAPVQDRYLDLVGRRP